MQLFHTGRPEEPRGALGRSAFILSIMLAGTLASEARADITRISSINGGLNGDDGTRHPSQIEVRPGEVIQLSADLFWEIERGLEAELVAQNRAVEEFIWSANDRADDRCDAQSLSNCLDHSQFQVTNYGVNFYVPYGMGRDLTISVEHRHNRTTDEITLINVYAGNAPPNRVITDPDDYNYDDFNDDYALAGQGYWVWISGIRYWVPHRHTPDWRPYQHGYWTWVAGDGWTWVSYDPWGWYTDHYGFWRNHAVYGWIWVAAPDRLYRPHVVTWIYGSGHVGWYLYHPDYHHHHNGYRHGYAEGFRDGYWDGYEAASRHRDHYLGGHFHPGHTVVSWGNFGSRNFFDVHVDISISMRLFHESHVGQFFGGHPGGGRLTDSRTWVETRAGARVVETRVLARTVRSFSLVRTVPVHVVPPNYARSAEMNRENFSRPVPIGSVVRAPRAGGRREVIPPTSNGRGIAPAPVDRRPPVARPSRPAPTPPIARPNPPHRNPPNNGGGHGGGGNGGGGRDGRNGGGNGGGGRRGGH